MADLKFSINGDASGGVAAVKGMQTALKNLASASTTASATQRANLKAVAQESVRQYKTIQEAQQKAIKLANDARIATANATNSRSIARNESTAKITNTTALTGARIDTERERQAGLAAINQQRQLGAAIDNNIKKQREYQASLRSTDQAAQNAHRVQMRAFQLQNAQQDHANQGLASTRYALYDVSRMAAVTGAALLALPVAAVTTAVKWEAAFAQVQRTNDFTSNSTEQMAIKVEGMRRQFVDLVQTIPASWEELTKIGTLAGQIGIANNAVVGFTRNVAMFAATTDVSAEDAATAFGRLNAFLPDVQGNFQGLGDSILKVGVNSVATESQIVRITTQIGSILAQAKFSSKEVVGLSGALASIAVPPELSRGVVTRVFGQIGRAANEGGGSLATFAKLSGRSAEDFKNSWGTEQSGQIFLDLMRGIQKEGANAENVLRSVGITSVRDVPVLIRLANAADSAGQAGGLLAQTFSDAANAGGEMQRQYNIIAGTVQSKITVLMNNLAALGDAVMRGSLGMFGDVLTGLSDGIRDFTNSLERPFELFGAFKLPFTNADAVTMSLGFVAIAGALALAVAGLGQLAAGMIALRQIGAVGGLSTIITSVAGVGTAATVASPPLVAMNRNLAAGGAAAGIFSRGATAAAGAARGLLAAIGPIPAILIAVAAAVSAAGWMKDFVSGAANVDALSVALTNSTDAAKTFAGIKLTGQGTFGNETKSFIKDFDEFRKQVEVYSMAGSSGLGDIINQRFSSLTGLVGIPSKEFANFSSGIEQMDDALGKLTGSGNIVGAVNAFSDLARTSELTGPSIDYLLSKMPEFKRALETQLATQGLEATDSNLRKLATGTLPGFAEAITGVKGLVDNAADSFEGGTEELSTFVDALTAGSTAFLDFGSAIDGATEDGVLSMEKFLENIRNQVAQQQAWQGAMKTLAGTVSTSFLEYLAGLGPGATDLIVGLASDPAALAAAEEAYGALGTESAQQFVADLTNGIAGAPTPVVGIDADPTSARSKLDTFRIAADGTVGTTAIDADPTKGKGVLAIFGNQVNTTTGIMQIDGNESPALSAARSAVDIINSFVATITVRTNANGVPVPDDFIGPTLTKATGGYISGPGTSTSDSIPARLSDGEYVVKAAAVRKLGISTLNQINRGRMPGSYASGGAVSPVRQGRASSYAASSSFSSTATIDAGTMQAIMAMSDRPVYLVVDGQLLATSASAGSKSLFNKGSN